MSVHLTFEQIGEHLEKGDLKEWSEALRAKDKAEQFGYLVAINASTFVNAESEEEAIQKAKDYLLDEKKIYAIGIE